MKTTSNGPWAAEVAEVTVSAAISAAPPHWVLPFAIKSVQHVRLLGRQKYTADTNIRMADTDIDTDRDRDIDTDTDTDTDSVAIFGT